MTTPIEILRAAARADAARPRLTWYDQDTTERVELSGTSLINWVDKTANLLVGELGLSAGGTVALDLPRHWLTAVWWLATDAVGGCARLGPDETADVAVFGPSGLANLPTNDELVALSLQPMGAAFDTPLPPLVRDFTLEVRSQPDHFSPQVPGDRTAGETASQRAAAWALTQADRVASAGPWQGPEDLLDALVAPLVAGGSAVWFRNPASQNVVSLLAAEGVTAWLDDPAAGLVLPPAVRWLDRSSVS